MEPPPAHPGDCLRATVETPGGVAERTPGAPRSSSGSPGPVPVLVWRQVIGYVPKIGSSQEIAAMRGPFSKPVALSPFYSAAPSRPPSAVGGSAAPYPTPAPPKARAWDPRDRLPELIQDAEMEDITPAQAINQSAAQAGLVALRRPYVDGVGAKTLSTFDC